jgi:hypothetical protein
MKPAKDKPFRHYLLFCFLILLLLPSYQALISYGYGTVSWVMKGQGLLEPSGRVLGSDFLPFWAAASLAQTGEPAAAYSPPRIKAMIQARIDPAFPRTPFWNYPPTFLLLILPLAYLPYLPALAVWLGVTGAGFLGVMRRAVSLPLVPWLALAFPGAVDNFLYCQNGFLSAFLLGGGLLLLERRPLAGGFLLGLLSYKPHLALLVPLALIAGRRWQALAAAGAAAAGLALASLIVLGTGAWTAFLGNIPFAGKLLDNSEFWWKMCSIYAAVRLAGGGTSLALGIQAVVFLAAAAAVVWSWRRDTPFYLRSSILIIAILLSTPYVFFYDLTLLALPFAWLGWEDYGQGRVTGVAFLLLLWPALYYARFLAMVTWVQPTPLLLFALFVFALQRSRRNLQGTPA